MDPPKNKSRPTKKRSDDAVPSGSGHSSVIKEKEEGTVNFPRKRKNREEFGIGSRKKKKSDQTERKMSGDLSQNLDQGLASGKDGDSSDSDCAMETPTLLEQLKVILDQYQDAQIIRELVQNAEDAKATKMKIIYVADHSEDNRNLYTKYFSAPALCVHNDAMFSPEDWTGIKRIYGSGKCKDSLKVGRFGIGFKSVFHMTDHPVIVSGDRLMVMDPLRGKKESECKILKFKKLPNNEEALAALISLFGYFGFTKDSIKDKYEGTLFWFPLRQNGSDLSTKIYNHRDIMEIISIFKREAFSFPLFLNNITSISLCEKDIHGEEKVLFSVVCDVVGRKKKEHFKSQLESCRGNIPQKSLQALYQMRVTVADETGRQEQHWFVCNFLKGKDDLSEEIKDLMDELCYSPFVGLAVPLHTTQETFHGQVFCFLPLPATSENQTGLPIHINGFFALSQDRHHVKWPSDEKIDHEDSAQKWNRLLCEEVVVDAYVSTIEHLKTITVKENKIDCDNNLVYRSLPASSVHPCWSGMVKLLNQHLRKQDIIYTLNGGGNWISKTDALMLLSKKKFDQLQEDASCKETYTQMQHCLFELLLLYKQNIVRIPSHVEDMLQSTSVVTPECLRHILKRNDQYKKCPVQDKVLLLQFVLADREYDQLRDLELVPLEDGTFCSFGRKSVTYVCSKKEMRMFPGMEGKFVKLDLPHCVRQNIKEIQNQGVFPWNEVNEDNFPKLLQETLDSNGAVANHGCFTPMSKFITKKWINHVWCYISEKCSSYERFETMHLLPVMTGNGQEVELFKLGGYYIAEQCKGMGQLNGRLVNALSALSITVVKGIPSGVAYDCVMDRFCKYPTVEGFLTIVEDLANEKTCDQKAFRSRIQTFNKKCLEGDKNALLEFLSKSNKAISRNANVVLKELEIFPESIHKSNVKISYTSVTKNDLIACDNDIPVAYPSPLLVLNGAEKRLAKNVGAREILLKNLVQNILEALENKHSGYSDTSIEKFMVYFLENIQLFKEHASLLDLASSIPFIKLTNSPRGNHVRVRELFDPENKQLQSIFYFLSDKFPPEKYCRGSKIIQLQKLGLKSARDIQKSDIHMVARRLDEECKKNVKNRKKIRSCSCDLMQLLESFTKESLNKFELNSLRSLCWIRYHDKKPTYYPKYLSWYGEKYAFPLCTPEDIISETYCGLSGSVACVVDYPVLGDICGWNKPPDVDICLEQLKVVRSVYSIINKAALTKVIIDIYREINKSFRTSDQSKLKERLCKEPVVCTGRGFHKAEKVYIAFSPSQDPINLEPYLFKLPDDFSEMSEMFIELGSTEVLDFNAYKNVISVIAAEGSDDRDRRMVVQILKTLVLLKRENDCLKDVLVPVQSSKKQLEMCYVDECTYCDKDSSWLDGDGGNGNTDEEFDIRYVHTDIKPKLAEKLGILSFTQRFLTDSGTEEIRSFGQSEPLTTRLKNLLESYPDGLSVIKELIQNADDAGAHRICFLYDERENREARDSLIDSNMEKCQGPALWAYNDSKFTESDFKNIIQLGGGTKMSSKTKIGKFGLGFCAVYNLTDVPSFVSGNSLVIFDPHTTHLGKAIRDKTSPGIRIEFSCYSGGMLRRMKNQFLPYNDIFGCDLSGKTVPPYFDGTLFRFPLRTKKQALESKIQSVSYTRKEIIALLSLMRGSAGDLLTFTQNVTEIKLYHLPEDTINLNEPNLVFTARKKILATYPDNINITNVMAEVEEKYMKTSHKNHFSYTQLISVQIRMLENQLLRNDFKCRSKHLLVSWASGSGKRLLEVASALEDFGALPLGSVAVLLKSEGLPPTPVPFPHQRKQTGFYRNGHFFCFLPLPALCKTPVHINGCFAVSNDRKMLAKGTEDEKDRNDKESWNSLLISDAVCNAYIALLNSLEHFGEVQDGDYSKLWPIYNQEHDEIYLLSNAFYKKITESNVKAFYNATSRVSFRECIFLQNDFRHNEKIGQYAFETFIKFYKGSLVPMDLVESVYHSFIAAECTKELEQQTMTVMDFYTNIVCPNIGNITETKRDALVLFALKSNVDGVRCMLQTTDCIPVKPSGRLRMPKETIRPQSAVSGLFCDEDERYPLGDKTSFCAESVLDILVELGMMDNNLPDDLIIERAKSISKLSDSKTSTNRCNKLLTLLASRKDSYLPHMMSVLKDIPFLPSLEKPYHWPLNWASPCVNKNRAHFVSPCRLFQPSTTELVACTQKIVGEIKFGCSKSEAKKLLRDLGVNDTVMTSDVEAQLLAISKVQINKISKEQKETLKKICHSVYNFLSSRISEMKENFDNLPILLMSGKMVIPKHATLQSFRLPCEPEIYQIHTMEYEECKEFLLKVGVMEKPSKTDILNALGRVTVSNEISVDKKTALLIVNLLELLVDITDKKLLTEDEIKSIYVPDDSNKLHMSNDLCIDDGYPLRKEKYMNFVHPKISLEICNLLQIKSKRVKHVQQIKGSIPFGQKEELVNRLNGILEGYPCDETIFYELLQNADDAGAKEINFVLDTRQHEIKKGLFGDEWAKLQGPALCVYNDACFSKKDLLGISSLGQGSKSQDPTKTGQFGVGFNAVYHLTDAPSFITRGLLTPNKGTFCVFDPHCAYCPDTDKNEPGLQIPNLDVLKQSYPGVYSCYLQRELSRHEGTWFRFPLRNKKMAASSRICQKEMNCEMVKSLLWKFSNDMMKSLLFLRNVRKISWSEIGKSGRLTTMYEVESSIGSKDEKRLKRFYEVCDTLTKEVYNTKTIEHISKHEVCYRMTVNDNEQQVEWVIAQTFGLEHGTNVPGEVSLAFKVNDIHLTPKGAVALPVSTSSKYENMDEGRLLDLNKSLDGQAFCFLPLPVFTGLPVHINGHFSLVHTRRAMWEDKGYRGLWNSLLLERVIPNSYILALEKLRDTESKLKKQQEVDFFLTRYHEAFPAYSEGKTDFIKNTILTLYFMLQERETTVFPVMSSPTTPVWWVALNQKEHRFPAYFNDLESQLKSRKQSQLESSITLPPIDYPRKAAILKETEDEAELLSRILKSTGMKLLDSPLFILESIKEAFNHQDKLRLRRQWNIDADFTESLLLTPSKVLDFLKSGMDKSESPDSCYIKAIDCDVKDTPIANLTNVICVLQYCLQNERTFIDNLEHTPMLVTNDEKLRRFSSAAPVYLSEFCTLLPESAEMFVHERKVGLMENVLGKSHCVKGLDLKSFVKMLPQSLDYTIHSSSEPIPWNSKSGVLNLKWIKTFWNYIDSLDFPVENLHLLRNWCFVPGETKQGNVKHKKILVPCDKSYILLSNMSFTEQKLRELVASLQIPSPLKDVFLSKTLKKIVSSAQNPVNMVKCLHYHKDKLNSISSQSCGQLLRYFSKEVKILQEKADIATTCITQLRCLPLYEDLSHKNVTLAEGSKIYTVRCDSSLPREGLEDWSNECHYTLLQENFFTKELMDFLNCGKIIKTVPELYRDHIFQHFYCLREHHMAHLTYVKNNLHYQKDFSNELQSLKFICHEGEWKTANCYYSPHVPVCRKLCEQSMLPPNPFGEEEWEDFMVCAGMKQTISADFFINFAKQLAQEHDVSDKVKSQSLEMVQYLFESDSLKCDIEFLEKIKNIRFLVPHHVCDMYQNICHQCNRQCLIQFCRSVTPEHAEVAWSTASVLSIETDPSDAGIKDSLGVLCKPDLSDVLSHIHNVCGSICKILKEKTEDQKYISDETISSLMQILYTYLQKHGMAPETKNSLSESSIVHLKGQDKFVRAKQLVIEPGGRKIISPYLVKIPLHYGQFADLFRFLGASQHATLHQYSDVLLCIKSEIGMHVMGPEQSANVELAIQGLTQLLSDYKKDEIETFMNEVETLYLPADNKTLMKSTDLVFSDNRTLKSRLEKGGHHSLTFVHNLRKCVRKENVICNLPDKLMPKVLSYIVTEILEYTPVRCEQDSKVNTLHSFLCSSRFQNIVKKIGKFGDEEFEEYKQRLCAIQFVTVTEIETVLAINGRKVEGTEEVQDCFYTEANGRICFYVCEKEADVRNWLKNIGQRLFQMLSSCVQKKISSEKFRELIDYMDDPVRFKKYCEEILDGEEYEDDESLTYHPGQFVPISLHALLQNTFEPFKIGELAAYEIFDPKIDGKTDEIDDQTQHLSYIFVKITDIVDVEGDNPVIQHYTVDFGDRSETVLGLRLYKVVYEETNSSTDLVPCMDSPTDTTPTDKNKIFDEIIKTLSIAWKLGKSEQKRVVKRLLLKWHPDKNRNKGKEYEILCKEVTQFIFEIIKRLENGEQFDDHDTTDSGSDRTDTAGRRSRRYRTQRNYDWWYHGTKTDGPTSGEWEDFADFVSSRYSQHRSTFMPSRGSHQHVPNPQPGEANRWFKQARMDFCCASDNLKMNKPQTYNWICFMCHQACEKACKAYMYSIDANRVKKKYHYLPDMISSENTSNVRELLHMMENICGSYTRTRYPDTMAFPKVPGEVYTMEDAEKAVNTAKKVLDEVQKII